MRFAFGASVTTARGKSRGTRRRPSYARAMEALLDHVRTQLGAACAGRAVILAGGVAAAASQPVDQLRGLGAERFLIASSGAGTGGGPDDADVELVDLLAFETAGRDDVIASFREEE